MNIDDLNRTWLALITLIAKGTNEKAKGLNQNLQCFITNYVTRNINFFSFKIN